jgi:hypothetical protein
MRAHPRRLSSPLRAALCALSAFAVAGCAIRPPQAQAPAPVLTASREELLARIVPGGTGVRTLQAAYSASFSCPARGPARAFSGMLALEHPAKLRMRGGAAMLPTLFDLLDDGDTVSVHMPRDRALYRGPSASGLPGGFPDAALLAGVLLGLRGGDGLVHAMETEPDRYLLHSFDPAAATLSRRVTFDRRDLSPVRYEYFDREGRRARDVRCAAFSPADGASASLPRRVAIEAPAEGARLVLRLSDLRVNPAHAAGMFTLAPPPGTVVRPLAECAQ